MRIRKGCASPRRLRASIRRTGGAVDGVGGDGGDGSGSGASVMDASLELQRVLCTEFSAEETLQLAAR
ncbi:hypothetical protein Sliba_63280 [Streptomyces nigrescens]|uniref:Uncharacterized protein n=1 Tax=Streptomyces nigrescens TaxID=1920 RepID=A0A640TUT0_STRNI|nr:hypothetical protein Sliba_63280 [Streptomyces libani subsp. libani]GGW03520.1 hypothetical protein GCM10010500_63370 [Streptomyces libani subsp. libani]